MKYDLKQTNRTLKEMSEQLFEEISQKNSKISELKKSLEEITSERIKSIKMSPKKHSILRIEEEKRDLEKELEGRVKTIKSIQKSIMKVAKKIKAMEPSWRPNTQTEQIFIDEVFKKVLKELDEGKKVKEGNRDGDEGKEKNKTSQLLSGIMNSNLSYQSCGENGSQKFFKTASFLDSLLVHIDDMNNNFDNCVVDDQGEIDTKKLFPCVVGFFENVYNLRNTDDFKDLMKEYHLGN